MTIKINPIKRFDLNLERLANLSDKSYLLYENLQGSFEAMRKMGFPAIGNPILRLKNKVLTLLYTTMQHQTNCELYASLITDNVLEEDLQLQLDGLNEMTDRLFSRYSEYLTEWNSINHQQKERKIMIDKLSIICLNNTTAKW